MDFFAERNKILASIPGDMQEKLMTAMMTGAFDPLIEEERRRKELQEKEMELLEMCLGT